MTSGPRQANVDAAQALLDQVERDALGRLLADPFARDTA
jgi:hypothetical protein